MSSHDDDMVGEAPETENLPISKRRSLSDASKQPMTITTTSSVRSRLVSKYRVVDLDKHDLERLHSAVENFTHTLVHTVLQSRQDAAYRAYQEGLEQGKSKVPRAVPSELWQALATSPSLRLIAHRFLAFKLVPEEHMHFFSDFTRHFPSSTPIVDENDPSDDEDINPFFLDTSSQQSGQ